MLLVGWPLLWAVGMSLKVVYQLPLKRHNIDDLRIPIATFCLFSLYGFAISFYFLFDHWINL
jgi:hypothetical protein